MIFKQILEKQFKLILAVVVLIVAERTSNAQESTYLLNIPQQYQSQPNIIERITHREDFILKRANSNQTETYLTNINEPIFQGNPQNTTIILYKNTSNSDFSETAMDVITIIWYVATFLALAAFFLLMACSDRRCSDAATASPGNANEISQPPPTPSPSYSEFAPPSYDTVIKMQTAAKPSIFVIPFGATAALNSMEENKEGNNNATNNSPANTPVINYYTIDELQKFGS